MPDNSQQSNTDAGSGQKIPRIRRPERHENGALLPPVPPPASALLPPSQYLPGGQKSLAGISVRAFGLGFALGANVVLTLELAYWGDERWRVACFITVLALFHYLEFDLTARYNPPDASVSSFLLLSNGIAYAAAHTGAVVEFLLRHSLSSHLDSFWLTARLKLDGILPAGPSSLPVALGLTLILLGQVARSAAMRQARTNFNHVVQWTKKDDHVLVTHGVYAFSRHPAYFGFFWWALGTQIMLGNPFCFVAYAAVLWKFFNRRIRHEERHLVAFFGQDYLDYREHTRVWIPFIP